MRILSINRFRASRLHSQAQKLSDDGNDDAALSHYYKALELDPDRPTTLYNIGLIFKYRGDWEESLRFNSKAYELAPNDEASRWNLAIAATALHRWELARKAWSDNGLEVDGSEGPINMDFGSTPVRLNPDDGGEVVWAKRIDPVRAEIESVPYPESGFRKGDIVLHDGAAVGHRAVEGNDYPVFNVLEIFEQSDLSTYRVKVRVGDRKQIDAMEIRCEELGAAFEDWTSNVRVLCRQCSEGMPHEEHDSDGENAWTLERDIGLSCSSEETVEKILSEWRARTGVEVIAVNVELTA